MQARDMLSTTKCSEYVDVQQKEASGLLEITLKAGQQLAGIDVIASVPMRTTQEHQGDNTNRHVCHLS